MERRDGKGGEQVGTKSGKGTESGKRRKVERDGKWGGGRPEGMGGGKACRVKM